MNKFYSQGFTAKESFLSYMREIGRDGHRVYSDIEETIAEVYLSKIADLRDAMKPYDQRYSSVLLCISDIWQAQ